MKQPTKQILNAIWSALCTEEESLISKLCENNISDSLKLELVADLKANQEAKSYYIVDLSLGE